MNKQEREYENIVIKLDKNNVYQKNVYKDLKLTTNVLSELLKQPSKYAWWATVNDIVEVKLKMSFENVMKSEDSFFQESAISYKKVKKLSDVLSDILLALEARKQVLLELLSNPKDKLLIDIYNKELKNLIGELGEDTRKSRKTGGFINVRTKHFKTGRAFSAIKQWR